MPAARGRDTNNIQPRAGLSWDVDAATGGTSSAAAPGSSPAASCSCPRTSSACRTASPGSSSSSASAASPSGCPRWRSTPRSPSTTGIALPRDANRNADSFVNPVLGAGDRRLHREARVDRAVRRLRGHLRQGQGRDHHSRPELEAGTPPAAAGPNASFNQINAYTNEGRSDYKAFVASVNGTLKGGHIVTASVTVASKKNINDDFSPALTDYPNDPANIEAEYSRSRADERVRFVTSAILHLPMQLHRGADLRVRIRSAVERAAWLRLQRRRQDVAIAPPGIPKFSQDGPSFRERQPARRAPACARQRPRRRPHRRDVQPAQPDELRRELGH